MDQESNRKDDELIRSGDAEALAAFLSEEKAAIIGFLRTICSNRLLAVVELDDLYQEVCSAALSSLTTAPLKDYTTMQWVQQVARRRVVDSHRYHFEAQRRDARRNQSIHGAATGEGSDGQPGLEAMLSASFTSASAAFSRDARMLRVEAAIGELNEEATQALRMRYSEGLPSKAIAERLGKSDAAIRVLLSRSLRQLEKRLADVRPTRN